MLNAVHCQGAACHRPKMPLVAPLLYSHKRRVGWLWGLWWIRPKWLITTGILIVIINGIVATLQGGMFLSPVDYGAMFNIPLPIDVKLSSGFLFEVAIALAVLGSVSLMLDTLGRPANELTWEESDKNEAKTA